MREGGLEFIFPEEWQVSKYDEWSFHRNRFQKCCGGCKAVDFLVIDSGPGQVFWLLEVKDYNRHSRTKTIDLAQEIAQKARDSLAGIATARFRSDEPEECSFAQRALQSSYIRVALHLEQPRKHSKLFPRAIDPAKVLQKLKALIKPMDPHPLIVERSNCEFRAGWSVEAARE
jgi:hypothetical protein